MHVKIQTILEMKTAAIHGEVSVAVRMIVETPVSTMLIIVIVPECVTEQQMLATTIIHQEMLKNVKIAMHVVSLTMI